MRLPCPSRPSPCHTCPRRGPTVVGMDPADPLVAERMLAYYAGEMRTRADRPLGAERTARVQAFADALTEADTVLEVGCGAGRDGRVLAAGRGRYLGSDLSPEGVAICRTRGLDARVASATALPVADAGGDAVSSRSTRLHLDPAAVGRAPGRARPLPRARPVAGGRAGLPDARPGRARGERDGAAGRRCARRRRVVDAPPHAPRPGGVRAGARRDRARAATGRCCGRRCL